MNGRHSTGHGGVTTDSVRLWPAREPCETAPGFSTGSHQEGETLPGGPGSTSIWIGFPSLPVSMPTKNLTDVLRRLRSRPAGGEVASVSDRELLRRFVVSRDAAAFEDLVVRHGPMVLDICRRALHDPHAAEDAFQATFLVLVRKAHRIGTANSWPIGCTGWPGGRLREPVSTPPNERRANPPRRSSPRVATRWTTLPSANCLRSWMRRSAGCRHNFAGR